MEKKYLSVSQIYAEICRRYEVRRGGDIELPRAGSKRVNRVFTFVSDFPDARRAEEVSDEKLDDWIEKAVERLVALCLGLPEGDEKEA